MGTIWTVIKIMFFVLRYAPQMWALISEFIKMINEIKDKAERQKAWKELDEAAKDVRMNGDTKRITKVFRKWVTKRRARRN
jgi:hypothetical protein